MGQLFMMGFDGTSVSPQIRSLIEDYHLGSVLLSAKNLKCIDLFLFLAPSNSAFCAPLINPRLRREREGLEENLSPLARPVG
jgi:hypothetical protein